MYTQLERLLQSLVAFREAVDRCLSQSLVIPSDGQALMLETLIATTTLYLDYLLSVKVMPQLESIATKRARFDMVPTDLERERKLRNELGAKFASAEGWPGFQPQNAFSDLTGLHTLQDYSNTLGLHLSEAYEESFRIEICAKEFLRSRSSSALAQLSVGLNHMVQHHIIFVLQALEFAASSGDWE